MHKRIPSFCLSYAHKRQSKEDMAKSKLSSSSLRLLLHKAVANVWVRNSITEEKIIMSNNSVSSGPLQTLSSSPTTLYQTGLHIPIIYNHVIVSLLKLIFPV